MLNEKKIIEYLKQQYPGIIGDDAGVFFKDEEYAYLATHDIFAEGTHFRRHWQSPEELAFKALQVNLSDIAAMGGKSQFALLGLSIPADLGEDYTLRFIRSFSKYCEDHQVLLLGGDTICSDTMIHIGVTMIGVCHHKNIKRKTTAKPHEFIGLIGELGYAHIGWKSCEENNMESSVFLEAFLRPKAKTQEGLWLAHHPEISSLTDVSDGLYEDLKSLLEDSNIGGSIDLHDHNFLPIFYTGCQEKSLDPLQTALTGGEDYGLLLTISNQDWDRVNQDFQKQFGYSIKKIGYTHTEPCSLEVFWNNQHVLGPFSSFQHF